MGSLTQRLDDLTSLQGLNIQSALGYAQPMIIPFRNIVIVPGKAPFSRFTEFPQHAIAEAEEVITPAEIKAKEKQALSKLGDTFFQCPLSFELDGEQFKLPIDPIISVNGKNVITRRYVSKSDMRGSIKESWSQDDYEISIYGVLMAENHEELMKQVVKLREICEARTSVKVICDYLQNNDGFNINDIAIESYDFPFTKGMENQSFSIRAYSDDGYSLLEEA